MSKKLRWWIGVTGLLLLAVSLVLLMYLLTPVAVVHEQATLAPTLFVLP